MRLSFEEINDFFNIFVTGERVFVEEYLYKLIQKANPTFKFYKYRAFNNENLECLRNGTLYCSCPLSFNDPFECRPAVSIEDMFDAKYGDDLLIQKGILDAYFGILWGHKKVQDFPEAIRPVLDKMINDCDLLNLFLSFKGKENNEDYINTYAVDIATALEPYLDSMAFRDCLKLLKDNPFEIDWLKKIPFTERNENTFDSFLIKMGGDENLDEIDNLATVTKVLMPHSNNSFSKLKNDVDSINRKIEDIITQIKVGCLSVTYNDINMWSHYACSHSGYCVEYDFNDKNHNGLLPMPIMYLEKRPIFPWKAFFEKSEKDILLSLVKTVMTKNVGWYQEDEWRFLVVNMDNNLLKMPKISRVYLGSNVSNENKNIILDIASKKGFVVEQMTMDSKKYALHHRIIQKSTDN